MTPPKLDEYENYEISLSELTKLPAQINIAPDATRYNTRSSERAEDILASNEDKLVQIRAHDSASDLNISFLTEEGQGYGVRAGWLLEEMGGLSLEEYLELNSPIGELGNLDFYQIDVYEEE